MSNNYKKRVNAAIKKQDNDKDFKPNKAQRTKSMLAYILALFMLIWSICSVLGTISFFRTNKSEEDTLTAYADTANNSVAYTAGTELTFNDTLVFPFELREGYANTLGFGSLFWYYVPGLGISSNEYLDEIVIHCPSSSNIWSMSYDSDIYGFSEDVYEFDSTTHAGQWISNLKTIVLNVDIYYGASDRTLDFLIANTNVAPLPDNGSGGNDTPVVGVGGQFKTPKPVRYNIDTAYDYAYQYTLRGADDYNMVVFPYYGLGIDVGDYPYINGTKNGINYTVLNDGGIRITGIATTETRLSLLTLQSKGFILENGQTYYLNDFSNLAAGLGLQYSYRQGNNTIVIDSGSSFTWSNTYQGGSLYILLPVGQYDVVLYPSITESNVSAYSMPISKYYYDGYYKAYTDAYDVGYDNGLITAYGSYFGSADIYYQGVSAVVDDYDEYIYAPYIEPNSLSFFAGGIDITDNLAYVNEQLLSYYSVGYTEYNGDIRVIIDLSTPLNLNRIVNSLLIGYGLAFELSEDIESVNFYTQVFDGDAYFVDDNTPMLSYVGADVKPYTRNTSYGYLPNVETLDLVNTIVITFHYINTDEQILHNGQYLLFDNDWGYNAALQAGEVNGYNKALDELKNDNLMYNEGYKNGYLLGYDSGLNASDNNPYTFTKLLTSVLDVPVKVFTSLFDFNVLGVNLTQFFLSLMSVCFVLVVIKLII